MGSIPTEPTKITITFDDDYLGVIKMQFVDRIQYCPDFVDEVIDTSLALRVYNKEKNNSQWLFNLLREED